MYRQITAFIFIFICLILMGCVPDAAHDNPADPYLSKSSAGVKFTGTVYTRYQPYQPLQNVKISVENIGHYVYSNNSGRFEIEGLEEKNYTFILEKANYQTDTVIAVISLQDNESNFYLNALPQLLQIEYYSIKVSTIFSAQPLIYVMIHVAAGDADGPGDIDSACVFLGTFNFRKAMQMLIPAGTFQITINEQDIAAHNIHGLVEQPLYIDLYDRGGARNRSGPFYISRFIENIPVALSPANQEVATQPLFLQWQETELLYDFSYELNIYRRESGLSQLVFSQGAINPKATYYNFTSLLDNGIYYWTIKIVDTQNNSSESKEAVFQIR